MRRIPILVVIAALASPLVFAQSRPVKRMTVQHRSKTVNISRPSKVTGDGMSTPSGVKYWDIQAGEGSPAMKGHVVKVLYTAWVENGKAFDSSTSIDKPTIFTIGAGQVIPGWEDGMEGMKAGGKRQIHVPAQLAYGAAGIPQLVPPNSNVIFDVVLLEVQ